MMGRDFLALVGLLYFGLSVWCVLRPAAVQEVIGLKPTGPSGQSEYLTIYGGLDLGLGLLCLVGAFWIPFTQPALLASALIHGGIVAFRVYTLLSVAALPTGIYKLAAAEIAIFAGSAILWWWKR